MPATPTPLKSPVAERLGLNESTYTREVLADGWTRFTVRAAKGSQRAAILLFLPLGALIGAAGGSIVLQPQTGIWVGLAFGFLVMIANASSWTDFDQHRARAGKFDVSIEGVRLANGKGWPRQDIDTVLTYNALAGIHFTVQARFKKGHFNTIGPLSYELAVESRGRRTPVVGCMTEATADALYKEVVDVLSLRNG